MRPLLRMHAMAALIVFAALLCQGCADRDVIGASRDARAAAQTRVSATLEGCARLEVAIGARGEVVVTPDTAVGCGPMIPVLAGPPTFDRPNRRLRIPLAVSNDGPARAREPFRLSAHGDSLRVLASRGLAENRHAGDYVAFEGADSVADATAIWRISDSLATPGLLAPRERTRPRWIDLRVHPGVHRLSVFFQASARRASPPVPLVAPDTFPSWIDDDSLEWRRTPQDEPEFLLHHFYVQFEEGAPIALREAAIEAVGGEVVGGYQFGLGEGWYLVRISDGTIEGVLKAVGIVDHMPGVDAAFGVVLVPPAEGYLRPRDEPGTFDAWRLHADSADGANWGLEAIDAPMAWGCATGDSTVAVAVADRGFTSVADLDGNLNAALSLGVGVHGTSREHGTRVSSVVAAEGDNRSRMTGVMWRADLRAYEIGVDSATGSVLPPATSGRVWWAQTLHRLSRAAQDGALVINFSIYHQWTTTPSESATFDTARRNAIARSVQGRLRTIRAAGYRPLIVTIAGNDSLDARWNGVAHIKDVDPASVIVVSAGGLTSGGGGVERAPFSSYGSLVDLAAPGTSVTALTAGNALVEVHGTSYAAPHVAGVAGLLMSFDPRLRNQPAEVKRLILAGAERGNRRIANSPVATSPDSVGFLNAYESLKLAAMRPGAPICGNAVWASTDTIFIRRDTLVGAVPEKIVIGTFADRLDILHGGRQLRMRLPVRPQIGYRWAPTGWAADASLTLPRFEDAVPGSGGAFLSWGDYYLGKLARSHDGDTAVSMVRGRGRDWDFNLFAYGSSRRLASVTDDANGLTTRACMFRPLSEQPDTAQKPCYIETLGPGTYRGTAWSYAYVQSGTRTAPSGRLLVVKAETGYTRTFGPWSTACPAMPGEWWIGRPDTAVEPGTVPTECRPFTTSARSVGTHYYLFDLAGRIVDQWFDATGENTIWGVSEDGRREMVTRYVYETDATFGIVPFGYIATLSQTGFTYATTCSLEERRLERGGGTRWTQASCPNVNTPTFGASRTPDRSARLLPEISRGQPIADARRRGSSRGRL